MELQGGAHGGGCSKSLTPHPSDLQSHVGPGKTEPAPWDHGNHPRGQTWSGGGSWVVLFAFLVLDLQPNPFLKRPDPQPSQEALPVAVTISCRPTRLCCHDGASILRWKRRRHKVAQLMTWGRDKVKPGGRQLRKAVCEAFLGGCQGQGQRCQVARRGWRTRILAGGLYPASAGVSVPQGVTPQPTSCQHYHCLHAVLSRGLNPVLHVLLSLESGLAPCPSLCEVHRTDLRTPGNLGDVSKVGIGLADIISDSQVNRNWRK